MELITPCEPCTSSCQCVDDPIAAIDAEFWETIDQFPIDSDIFDHLSILLQSGDSTATISTDDDAKQSKQTDRTDDQSKLDDTNAKGDNDNSGGKRPETPVNPQISTYTRSNHLPAPNDKLSYVVSKDPPTKAMFGPVSAAEPCCLEPSEYQRLRDAFSKANPTVTSLETFDYTPDPTLTAASHNHVILEQEHIDYALPDHPAVKEQRKIYKWSIQGDYWSYYKHGYKKYVGQHEANPALYTGPKPMPYNTEQALTPKFLPDNILYGERTYCLGCRHKTFKHDPHWWCFRCIILSGFWPCTGETGALTCIQCHDVMKNGQIRQNSYFAWRKLYHNDAFDIPILLQFKPRLSPRIAVHFDAIVNMVLSGLKQKRLPLFNLDWNACLVLAKHYNNQLPHKQPSLPTMDEHRAALLKIKPKPTTEKPTGRRSDAKTAALLAKEKRDIALATQKSLDDAKKTTTPRKQKPKGDRPTKSADSTPNKPFPAITPPDPKSTSRKRKHDTPCTMTAISQLTPPWNQIGFAILGIGGVAVHQLHDGRVSISAGDTLPTHVKERVRRIWNGDVKVTPGLAKDDGWLIIEDPLPTDTILPPPDISFEAVAATALTPISKRQSFQPTIKFQPLHNFDFVFSDDIVVTLSNHYYQPYFPQISASLQSIPIYDVNEGYEPLFTTPTSGTVIRIAKAHIKVTEFQSMSADELRAILAQFVKPNRETISNSIFTHSWWRAAVPPPNLTPINFNQMFHKAPLLLPIGDPYADSDLAYGNRPIIEGAPTPRRPSVPFLGLTDTLMTYLEYRAAEQEYFVAKSPSPMGSVFRSRSMRIFNAPYLEHSHVSFPVTAMHIPRAEDWPTQLHRPINYHVAYPVHDLSVRYMEELTRTHLYHTCHREQSLHILDRQLQQLYQIVRMFAPSQMDRAQCLINSIREREWHSVLDSYSILTELLSTAITTRRQGFLSLSTDALTLEEQRAALSRPYTDSVILKPEPPKPAKAPSPPPRRSVSKSPPRRTASRSPPPS